MGILVLLLVVGGAGFWFGLIEDVEIGFLVGILALAAGTYAAFTGLGAAERAEAEGATGAHTREDSQSMVLTSMIVGGLLVGAAAIWFGMIEDMKYLWILGILSLAGATLATFRGKAGL
jgi:hypothetical protein